MTASNTTAPLYVQFAQALRAEIAHLGLPAPISAPTETGFPQNAGYFFVRWDTADSAALIIPQSKTRMGNLHSHVDLSRFQGHVALPRRNGRVVCHFTPDVALVSKALHLFVGASKRPVAPPVRRLIDASQATPVAPSGHSVRIGTAADIELPAGDSEIASWGTTERSAFYSDDEAEEALQTLIHQAD